MFTKFPLFKGTELETGFWVMGKVTQTNDTLIIRSSLDRYQYPIQLCFWVNLSLAKIQIQSLQWTRRHPVKLYMYLLTIQVWKIYFNVFSETPWTVWR